MRPKQSSKQVDNHTKLDVDLQAKIGESLRRCFVDVLRLHALRRQTDQSVANALHFRVHRRLPRQNHADLLEGNELKYDFKSCFDSLFGVNLSGASLVVDFNRLLIFMSYII